MPSTVLDSDIFKDMFGSADMRAVFSDDNLLKCFVEAEVALAIAQGRLGVIPQDAADAIAKAAPSVPIDRDVLKHEAENVGYPILGLVRQLSAKLGEAGRYVHWGATTQDIVDTAMQLQIRDAIGIIAEDLRAIDERLATLARQHRATAMIGRTFLQHARPTTFGMRAALWLDAVTSCLEDLEGVRAACSLQLGGPVGVFDGLGGRADEVAELVATSLGLRRPDASWHGDRSRVAAACSAIARAARCMAKIATDVALLASSEIAEITVRAGASSSMVGKRNPFDAVRTIACADACAGLVATVAGARPIELERGIGGWHVEWFAVPLVFTTAAASTATMRACLDSLDVDATQMLRNLGTAADPRLTEQAAATIDRLVARRTPQPG